MRQPDRADHHGGGDHRVRAPHRQQRPLGITAGPDGALWFTGLSGNRIGRITTAGVITEFTVPTADSVPIGITAGPDGALWFTERQRQPDRADHHRRGRSPSSPVPTANSGPIGITAGPDGALWFTERTATGSGGSPPPG